MKVARASYLAGFAGTSNVRAGQQYGIPIVGTMAHSFIMSFEHEVDAFRSYVAAFPNNAILLIDTYDTTAGARNAARVAKEMAGRGQKLIGVRIDSGDLGAQAHAVRKIFNETHLPDVKIIGSGGLDEYDLAELSAANAPFDSYGVGTKMGTSADAPWSDMSYKLVEYQERAALKLSTGKASWPERKQVFRARDKQNKVAGDVIGGREENCSEEKLLREYLRDGERVDGDATLSGSRKIFAEDFAALPESVKALRNPARYPVAFSARLIELRERTTRELDKN